MFDTSQLLEMRHSTHDGFKTAFSEKLGEVVDEITMESEFLLTMVNVQYTDRICRQLKLPNGVRGTAITFFKRFFLRNSIWKISAKKILMSSIYLA